MRDSVADGIDNFAFDIVHDEKPAVLALDREQAEIGLNEFFKRCSPSAQRIRDNDQLHSARAAIDQAIKYVRPTKRVASVANALLSGMTLSQEGLSMGLNGVLNMQPPSAVSVGLPSLYLIDEDAIEPSRFAEFVSRFQQIGFEKKPRILMLANGKLESALKLISTCGQNVRSYILSSGGLTNVSPSQMNCNDFGEFVNLFLSEGDGYCASSDIDRMFPDADPESRIGHCVATMLQIQSLFRSGRKFEAIGLIADLDAELEHLNNTMRTESQRDRLLGLKAICNLWTSYVFEDHPEKIENSLSIAGHLKDDLLEAYALKLIPMVSGRSDLTRQMLEKAKQIFESKGEVEQALFVENNIIDNNLFSDRIDAERALRLSEYVRENTPYIRRSTTFHSNAAIALMLSGRMTQAREVFDLATRSAGPSVNLLTSHVNALICAYLDGEKIDHDVVSRTINRILRSRIDPNFDYHQAIMFGNLWKICEDKKDLAGEIIEILRKHRFLDYGTYLDDPHQFMRFCVSKCYDSQATMPVDQPGILGAFMNEHSLFPASHVFYR